jgi:glucose/mannose-6-phosphate isomerase
VIDLDDPAAIAAADPSGMLDAMLAMPEHCRLGYRAGRSADDLPSGDGIDSLVVCGMGGSGLSGDVVRALYQDRLGIPITVVKGPVLPEFCGKDTLVVCSSFSGGTAETLACFEEAAARGCRLVAVASGGALAERAGDVGVAVVEVPGGFPAPRAAVGHLAFGALGALERIGVIPALEADVEHTGLLLESLAAEIAPDVPRADNRAKALAARIGDRIPVVWGSWGVAEVAATRWKTQLNENAKVPAFCSVLPELNHNEVVGWSQGQGERFLLLVLRHEDEYPDVRTLFPAAIDVVSGGGLRHEEVWGTGDSPLSVLMSLIMLGDAMTVYLGLIRGVDPTPIEAISRLKQALASAGVSEPARAPEEEEPQVRFEREDGR